MKKIFFDMIQALHVSAGLKSIDLVNFYDAVVHPVSSILLQAFKVPLMVVVMTLSFLQTMSFFLCNGYGVPEQGYGSTIEDPNFGYGRGNGMAPPGFLGVCTLMSNGY